MQLDTLASIASIVGNFGIPAGLVFAALQLRDARRQTSDTAAIELARIWHEPNFGRHMRLILELPAGISCKELVKRGADHADAALVIAMTIETVGLMVKQGILRVDTVWQLIGGMTLTAWDRLEDWILNVRLQQDNEKFAEWFEWLVLQLQEAQQKSS